MRRLLRLIEESRAQTENADVSTTIGIQDEEFIRYFNNAQDRIQSLIHNVKPGAFLAEKITDVVSQQEAYDIPQDAYLSGKIDTVDYSFSGSDQDYYTLRKGTLKERFSGNYGEPSTYIPRGSKILLAPVPQSSSSKVRFMYVKKVNRLDLPRGSILTSTTAGTTLSALTMDTAGDTVDADLTNDIYMCICDPITGEIKMRNIAFTAVDAGTGVVTLANGSHTFEAGETITAGDIVVRGKNTSFVSELPDELERYLIEYCNWRIARRDANTVETPNHSGELQAMEGDIVAAYSSLSDDNDELPITDSTYLDDMY